MCGTLGGKVTDTIDSIQTEDNTTEVVTAFIDVARGAYGRMGAAS
jgi:hypothetical protein